MSRTETLSPLASNPSKRSTGSTRSKSRRAKTADAPTRVVSQRARGRRGESLSSPRDRERLRERIAAERARVERMLASAPLPVERRDAGIRPETGQGPLPDGYPSNGLRAVPAHPGSKGCPICGDGRIVTDEVMHGGTLRMSECLHCDHRWTHRPRKRWVELGSRMNRGAGPRPLHVLPSEIQPIVSRDLQSPAGH